MQSGSLGSWFGDDGDPQAPYDVAVVTPSVLRPSLLASLESVFRQDLDGRIQVLIGVDAPTPTSPALLELIARRPAHVAVLLLTLPYSTSIRHGGVHRATDGGALRSILTFMASSRHVAYLDDDNSWERDHLSALRAEIEGKAWAYSLRMLVDEASGRELGIDRWDSVGPNRGRFAERGGFVDPNCLMIDKLIALRTLGRWSQGPGMQSDRAFFEAIRLGKHGHVPRATTRYSVRAGTDVFSGFMAQGVEF
ncbi:glycosyltransferase family 2 protein [Phenylobacterium sp. LjRoot164]|uniref:glycosyltransferase family A protein n=1 Tax=unclassified Phenylobacterium TaxID=2640670 RepID=UPI003ECEA91A